MAQDKSAEPDPHAAKLPSRSEEAHNLAQEALEEIQHGNKEEGEFLMAEAKALDPAATKDVLKKDGGKG